LKNLSIYFLDWTIIVAWQMSLYFASVMNYKCACFTYLYCYKSYSILGHHLLYLLLQNLYNNRAWASLAILSKFVTGIYVWIMSVLTFTYIILFFLLLSRYCESISRGVKFSTHTFTAMLLTLTPGTSPAILIVLWWR
jgi:hypothetical protein